MALLSHLAKGQTMAPIGQKGNGSADWMVTVERAILGRLLSQTDDTRVCAKGACALQSEINSRTKRHGTCLSLFSDHSC